MSAPSVLFVGASGYIGGSILDRLLKSTDVNVRSATYTALIRSPEQASRLLECNVKPVLFKGLDDVDFLRQQASNFDIVINSADAFNSKGAEALILGLGDRQKNTGKETIYLHTSGTSSVGQYPVPEATADRIFLSDKDDVYSYLVERERERPYAQRTTDVAVVETGLSANVKTLIIMSPTIYGPGSGLFNRETIQIPGVVKRTLRRGKATVHSNGTGQWDHVHIDDLTKLYELLFGRLLRKESLPTGKEGIYFSENGHFNWKEASIAIANAGVELGALKTSEVNELGSEEWFTVLRRTPTASNLQAGELGFASWSRTSADLGRSLGWVPEHGQKSWEEHFLPTFKAVLDAEKKE